MKKDSALPPALELRQMDETTRDYYFNYRHKLKGLRVRLCGLTSERGMALNDRLGYIDSSDGIVQKKGCPYGLWEKVDCDRAGFRVKVSLDRVGPRYSKLGPETVLLMAEQMDRPSEKVSIKLENMDVVSFGLAREGGPKSPPLDPEAILSNFRASIQGVDYSYLASSRPDVIARKRLVESWIKQGAVPSIDSVKCCDPSVGGAVDLARLPSELVMSTPFCKGNGLVDFSKYSLGLTGDGETECPLCMEKFEMNSQLILLSCCHQLHPGCCASLEQSFTRDGATAVNTSEGSATGEVQLRQAALQCPICRKYEFCDGSHSNHSTSADERTLIRFREWVQSGFCIFCQSEYLENIQFKDDDE